MKESVSAVRNVLRPAGKFFDLPGQFSMPKGTGRLNATSVLENPNV
jgi:hypothetical protein